MALDKLHEKFGHRINVVTEIAEFDKNETLHFKGKAHKSHDEILGLLQPDTIIGIHNYHGGGSKYLFYDERPGRKVITRYVDDNPYKYLRVYLNGELLEKDAGHDYAGHFIHHVDTGRALTTEDYFVKHQESRQAWLQD